MELFSIIWQFLLLWVFLYIIVFLLQITTTRKKQAPSKRKQGNSALLPTFSILVDEPLERDQWSIKLFQVKYTTQRLNKLFSKITLYAPRFWRVWFTLGVVAASVLMVVGMGVILFAGIKIISSLGQIMTPASSNHKKRDIGQDDQVFLPMVKKYRQGKRGVSFIHSYL